MESAEKAEETQEVQEVETLETEPQEEVISEPWMETEEETGDQQPAETSNQVPVSKYVKLKKKLRGQISERDEELERLRIENAKLKKTEHTPISRPNRDDFISDDDYHDALDKYFDDRAQETYQRNQIQKSQEEKKTQHIERVKESVDKHYERAAVLVEKAGIDEEVYKNADMVVRHAVETIQPKMGDVIMDEMIANLGEGSEKVVYYLGRNPNALNQFQSLLVSDPSGLKAAIYLGQQKQRLTNPTKPKSRAPEPAPEVEGDISPSNSGLKKKYDAAHKKGNMQEAYNIKKMAKKNGVDVARW